MKFSIAALAAVAGLASALPSQPEARATTVQGFDISNHQKSVNFDAAKKDGAQFVMIKVRYFQTIPRFIQPT
jgi:GH25 family lysozyme M1 (1,4-beta-N-acetylmuramidase)